MTKAQIKAWVLSLAGIAPEAKTELEKQANALPDDMTAPQATPSATDPVIAQMVAKAAEEAVKAAIAPMEKALADSEARHKAAADAATAAATAARSKEVKDLLDAAIAAGKIPADNKEKRVDWEKNFNTNFDTAKFALEQIPAATAQNPDNRQAGASGGNSSSATTRTGMAAHIRSNAIADYINSVPIAEAVSKN